jgi:hypothetical protein
MGGGRKRRCLSLAGKSLSKPFQKRKAVSDGPPLENSAGQEGRDLTNGNRNRIPVSIAVVTDILLSSRRLWSTHIIAGEFASGAGTPFSALSS